MVVHYMRLDPVKNVDGKAEKKLGPVEIGWAKGYKPAKYDVNSQGYALVEDGAGDLVKCYE